jgi:hypothetical protein
MLKVASKCGECVYYVERWGLSGVAHGRWDFNTCNEICYKTLNIVKSTKEVEANRIACRERYRQTHITKYNTTGRKVGVA